MAATAEATRAPAYCLMCARECDNLGPSLDPGRPVVRCHWTTPDGTPHGHGRTVGTYSQDEAQAQVAARLELNKHHAHARGSHDGKRTLACPDCRAAIYHERHEKLSQPEQTCAACRADRRLSRILLGID